MPWYFMFTENGDVLLMLFCFYEDKSGALSSNHSLLVLGLNSRHKSAHEYVRTQSEFPPKNSGVGTVVAMNRLIRIINGPLEK
jgi:hypothetical protein